MGKIKPYIYEVGEIVSEGTLRVIDQIRMKRSSNSTQKGYLVQSLTYPNAPLYEVTEGNLKQGKRDSYVYGKKVCDDNSLWSIKETRKYLNEQEAKNKRLHSMEKTTLTCDICSFSKKSTAADITRYGFSCPICSTKTSYPEIFFISYLQVKGLKYQYQVGFDGSRRKIDFYILDLDLYVEVHGITHYENQHGSAWKDSYERTLKSDNIKREWCRKNNKILIELDCRKSEFEFIKNNINSSLLLPNISKDEIPKIEKIIQENRTHNSKEVIKLYESGMSYHSVAEKLDLGPTVVYNILKKSNVKMRNINDTRKKKVRCVETGVIYESGREVSRILGINQGNLARVCRERRGTVGGFHWEYVEEDN